MLDGASVARTRARSRRRRRRTVWLVRGQKISVLSSMSTILVARLTPSADVRTADRGGGQCFQLPCTDGSVERTQRGPS